MPNLNFNPHFTYLLILACSLAGPLALSFDKKIAFYTKWKALLPALVLPAVFYIVWDIYFTRIGVWRFNEKYITGIRIANLPVEEVLFFVLIPYCCVFVYECIRYYFPAIRNKRRADIFMKCLAVFLFIMAVIFHNKYYSSLTFLFNAIFISLIYVFKNHFKYFDAASFLTAYLICLIPFLLVNGFLTSIPVVIYNNAENLGIRLFSIPVEDIFYGMLLILMIICKYERKLRRNI